MNKTEFRQYQDDWRQALIGHKKDSGRALESTTIRVALALQHYEHAAAGEDQCCAFPTRSSLAVRLGLEGKPEHQRRTITKHLTALEKAGFIVKIREGIRPSYEYPKGQSAKWRLTIPVEDKKRLDSMWDEPASPDGVGGSTEQEVGGSSEQVGGSTEQETRSVSPEDSFSSPHKPVQLAHPTTPDYQPLTDQPLTHTSETSADNSSSFNEKNLEEFREAYPKAGPKIVVKDAYKVALSQGATPEQLLASAKNYADECQNTNQEMRYMIAPGRFLGEEQWRNYEHHTDPEKNWQQKREELLASFREEDRQEDRPF